MPKSNTLSDKVLELTVAYSLSQSYLESLLLWARENIDPRIELTVKVDSGVVAGAIISYQGRYLDLSLGPKLDAVLAKKYG